jgi:hypothetical protein
MLMKHRHPHIPAYRFPLRDLLEYCKGFYQAHATQLKMYLPRQDVNFLESYPYIISVPSLKDDAGWKQFHSFQ